MRFLLTVAVVLCACVAQSLGAPSSSTFPPPPKSYTHPQVSTSAPVVCEGSLKIIVPLYMEPGAAWDEVAAGARHIPTIAILNPRNLPTSSEVDATNTYATYMQKMHEAGVVMVGYVDTNYGTRKESAVKVDIDYYAAEYPLLSGVFLDRTSARANTLPYYENLYTYILSMPGWTHDIINPGIVPTSKFLSVSTHIVSLSDYASSVSSAPQPAAFTCAQRDHYAALVHSVADEDDMRASVDALLNKSYMGYIYVTDGGEQDTHLSTHYAAMISYILTK